jgi:orotate phosphoribosyltransferase
MISARIDLLKMILEKSYREGDFTLSSGQKSNFYIDLKPTILHPEGAAMVGALCVEWMLTEKLTFQGVGGLTLGADPIVMAVSLAALQKKIILPATMIRKEAKKHGPPDLLKASKILGKAIILSWWKMWSRPEDLQKKRSRF